MDAALISSLVLALPLAFFGMYYLMKYEFIPRVMAKRGYVRATQLLENGRLKTFFAKPETITTEDNEVKTVLCHGEDVYDYYDDPRYFVFDDKGVKNVFYDSKGNLVSIEYNEKIESAVPKGIVDALLKRTWNTAKAVAFKEKMRLDIFVLVAAGASVICVLLVFGMMDRLDQILGAVNSIKSACAAAKAATPIPS